MSKIKFPSSGIGMIGLIIMLCGFALDTLFNNGNPTIFGSMCLMVGAAMIASGIVAGTLGAIINKEEK